MAEGGDDDDNLLTRNGHGETYNTLQEQIQGYDYEFYPSLDSKFECPICLLCQRDPTQTSCGHRFCRSCIYTWIRMEGRRCPEDNSPITEQDLFPDNFAKREILSLIVHCPNRSHGCHDKMELGHVEEHQQMCDYQQIPCSNKCSMLVLRRFLENHLNTECLKRTITCSLCCSSFPLSEQQIHFKNCPMVTVACECCGTLMARQQLEPHKESECPKLLVPCNFSNIGCKEKVERHLIPQHEQSFIHKHLSLLLGMYSHLQYYVNSLASTTDGTSRSAHKVEKTSNQTLEHYQDGNVLKPMLENMEKLNVKSAAVESLKIEHQDSLKVATMEKDNSSLIEKLLTSPNKGFDSWINPPSVELLQELCQRNVQLEQKTREQELKLDALRQRVIENEKTIVILSDKIRNMDTRFCNGTYYWKVSDFLQLKNDALRGCNRVLHSPGFYTTCYGYKVCLRLNIQGKGRGTYVSLFIHLMQGDHDDLLDWPFVGKITLTVLDQSDDTNESMHVTETMHTKPGLAAFQRPSTERNPKGFGYTEFIAVDTLIAGNYLKNDTLIVRAIVTT